MPEHKVKLRVLTLLLDHLLIAHLNLNTRWDILNDCHLDHFSSSVGITNLPIQSHQLPTKMFYTLTGQIPANAVNCLKDLLWFQFGLILTTENGKKTASLKGKPGWGI